MRIKKPVIKPWMGFFGLFGFAGFIGVFIDPSVLCFFGFFAFFAFYWAGKLAKEKPDERLFENQQKAMQIAMRTGIVIVWGGMIVIANIWGSKDPAKAYFLLNLVISLAFAVCANLSAYLAYRFDKNGCSGE